jgi:hypothetical protein
VLLVEIAKIMSFGWRALRHARRGRDRFAMSVRDAAAKERPSPMSKNNQTGERHWRKMMMLGCAQTIA